MREVYTCVRDNETLDKVLEGGLKSRAKLIEEGALPDTLARDQTNVQRQRTIYAQFSPPPESTFWVSFMIYDLEAQVGNISLVEEDVYDPGWKYNSSVMPLSEYVKKIEIEKDKPRHPTTAMPIQNGNQQQVYEQFGMVGYYPEILVRRDQIPTDRIKQIHKPEESILAPNPFYLADFFNEFN